MALTIRNDLIQLGDLFVPVLDLPLDVLSVDSILQSSPQPLAPLATRSDDILVVVLTQDEKGYRDRHLHLPSMYPQL